MTSADDAGQFNERYAELAATAKDMFAERLLPKFLAFSPMAELELPKDERPEYFATAEPYDPDVSREPTSRFFYGERGMLGEDVFQFGTYQNERRKDGSAVYDVVVRRITARVYPLLDALTVSAFIFEDRGGPGSNRHSMEFPSVFIPLSAEWGVEGFLLTRWRSAINVRSDELGSQYRGEHRSEIRLIPKEFTGELS